MPAPVIAPTGAERVERVRLSFRSDTPYRVLAHFVRNASLALIVNDKEATVTPILTLEIDNFSIFSWEPDYPIEGGDRITVDLRNPEPMSVPEDCHGITIDASITLRGTYEYEAVTGAWLQEVTDSPKRPKCPNDDIDLVHTGGLSLICPVCGYLLDLDGA